ncbi:MAG: isoprenylcysteine carboxylmethyltransferase family protein [Elusimicrobia bacterium]|nr:isoprenylcysteine carboxylmethyltransferase family protein [Elusimicrobiota bacterium]
MKKSFIIAILLLPGPVLVFVPCIILLFTKENVYPANFFLNLFSKYDSFMWLSLPFFIAGLILIFTTVKLFLTKGEGTPATWNPPKKLIVKGPYKYVRNPMITGALLILIGESLFFGSYPLALWTLLFFIMNVIYFPFFEEKTLEKKFGKKYTDYQNNVPRWLPRLKPWNSNAE